MQINKKDVSVSISVRPVNAPAKDRDAWIEAIQEDKLTKALETFVKEVAFYPSAPDLAVSHCMKLNVDDANEPLWTISIPALESGDAADVPIFFIDTGEPVEIIDGVDVVRALGITIVNDFWSAFVIDNKSSKYVSLLGELLSRVIPTINLRRVVEVELELSTSVMLSSLELGIFLNILPFDVVYGTTMDTMVDTATVQFGAIVERSSRQSVDSGIDWEEKTNLQVTGLQTEQANGRDGLLDLLISGRAWGTYDYKYLLSIFVDHATACIARIESGDGSV